MVMQGVVQKLRSLARLSGFEIAWLLPAWILLGLFRLAILLTPFRHLARWLGVHEGIAAWVPLLDPSAEARALSVARVVQTAARHTPWDSNCFPQALVARLLLGAYGVPYAVFFGVMRDVEANSLKAHAWVSSGRVSVTGGRSFDRFTVVAFFVSDAVAGDSQV